MLTTELCWTKAIRAYPTIPHAQLRPLALSSSAQPSLFGLNFISCITLGSRYIVKTDADMFWMVIMALFLRTDRRRLVKPTLWR
ncbi:Interferon-induced helicase C domain-containing protein 1 [Labeo rohita]|uniref:Interferon-induced helicase C domain-containing protein 1 n=1 Tax=Labeo rohita TaxID=84645 RepID=A0ABQ8MM65_LABRO|nr:Interferon-induced helicase C domain-containing protein 1 [Labeo rohita]